VYTPEACYPPYVCLRAVALESISVPLVSVDTEAARKVKRDPVQLWRDWKVCNQRPIVDWRTDVLELMMQVMIRTGPVKEKVRCLVDTGARLPITVREGLVPVGRLRRAKFPVRFTTVAGQHMRGGTKGLFLQFQLPVRVSDGTENDFEIVRTQPLFAFEAALDAVDDIIGYPFLKAFNLMVDCAQNCLRPGPSVTKGKVTSPYLIVESDNVGLKGKRLDPKPQPGVAAFHPCEVSPVMEGDESPGDVLHLFPDESDDQGSVGYLSGKSNFDAKVPYGLCSIQTGC